MAPLLVLITTFIIAVFVTRSIRKDHDIALAARIAMSVMLLFTSIGHFAFAKGMAMMMPDFIPYKLQLVYVTGIIEILAAIGLQVPRFRVLTAWLLILFFVLVLPANIHAAINKVDYQKGTYEGAGTNYLWFRIPLQILFIVWSYLCAVKYSHRSKDVKSQA